MPMATGRLREGGGRREPGGESRVLGWVEKVMPVGWKA